MEVELLEIQDFLAAHHPFDLLPGEVRGRLARELEVRYERRGSVILEPQGHSAHLFIVRSGAVETRNAQGELLARLGEGDLFGGRALLHEGLVANRVVAIEDCLLYLLPAAEFHALFGQYKQFAYHFDPVGLRRLKRALRPRRRVGSRQGPALVTRRIRQLLGRSPVVCTPDESVQEGARRMGRERVSCLVVVEGERVVGILTDRDLRNRVLAEGRDPQTPVGEVMTSQPFTIDIRGYTFDALMTMVRKNIHHLPVLEGGRLAGVISTTDLTRNQCTSAVYLVGDIAKLGRVEELQGAVARLPKLMANLVTSDASAFSIGHIVTTVNDAVAKRLLHLAEEELGPPPVPYLWLVAGSQARREQTAVSDQDNVMILDDAYREGLHGPYFSQLAQRVCDGLNACGYTYCPGDTMATNPQWRQPLAVWKRYFQRWIGEPEPKALMLYSIFFDLRGVHGARELLEALREHTRGLVRGNQIFLAYLASNALSRHPPLGFFRNFVLIRGGQHHHTLDLKHNGIIPIVDLARVYALEGGGKAVNTVGRLHRARKLGIVSPQGARDLEDALEFIAKARLRHQAGQIRNDQPPDNFLAPEELSHLERSQLKDAFAIVRDLQSAMEQRHQLARFQ